MCIWIMSHKLRLKITVNLNCTKNAATINHTLSKLLVYKSFYWNCIVQSGQQPTVVCNNTHRKLTFIILRQGNIFSALVNRWMGKLIESNRLTIQFASFAFVFFVSMLLLHLVPEMSCSQHFLSTFFVPAVNSHLAWCAKPKFVLVLVVFI